MGQVSQTTQGLVPAAVLSLREVVFVSVPEQASLLRLLPPCSSVSDSSCAWVRQRGKAGVRDL